MQTGTFPGEQRSGFVYLPPASAGRSSYPVVYLLHGMPGIADRVSRSAPISRTGPTPRSNRARSGRSSRCCPRPGRTRSTTANGRADRRDRSCTRSCRGSTRTCRRSRTQQGRVIAGLSAGGFGAVDIALRHPGLFGAIEAWSAYFSPLRDGPFRHAPQDRAGGERPDEARPHARATPAPGSHALLPLDRAGPQPLVQAEADARVRARAAQARCARELPRRMRTHAANGARSSTPGSRGRFGAADAIRAQRARFPAPTPLARAARRRHTLRIPPGAERE